MQDREQREARVDRAVRWIGWRLQRFADWAWTSETLIAALVLIIVLVLYFALQ